MVRIRRGVGREAERGSRSLIGNTIAIGCD